MADLDGSHRVTAIIETIDNEIATFRVSTGERQQTEWDDLATAMGDFVAAMQSEPAVENILGTSTLIGLTVDQWIPSLSKYAQVFSSPQTGPSRTVDTAPMQCAAVVTTRYMNPPPGSVLQRYRNRFYVGPIVQACLNTDGKITIPYRDQLAQQAADLDTALAAISLASGAPAGSPPGLGVASVAGNHIFQADVVEVGNIVDTQRRRRNKLVETRSVVNITL